MRPLYHQRPLVLLASAAWAGTLLAGPWPRPCILACWGAGLLLVAWAWWQRQSAWAGLGLVAAAGLWFAGLGAVQLQAPLRDVSWLGFRRDLILEGKLSSLPEPVLWGQAWRSRLRCHAAVWKGRRYPVRGEVYLQAPGPAPDWLPNDLLKVRGSLEPIAKPLNPGEYDFAAHACRRGVRSRLQIQLPEHAQRLQSAGAFDGPAGIGRLRRWCLRQLTDHVRPPGCRWVRGIVVGDRSGLSPADRELLAAAGLAHILAVSGMNVGLIFALVYGLASGARVPRWAAMGAALAASWAYTLITGADPPVARSAWMLSVVALTQAVSREPDSLSGLSLAALLLLAASPLAGADAGFQLSFAATAAIVLVWPALQRLTREWWQPAAWLAASLLLTATILLATAPLTLYHFYNLTPGALLANLPAIPLASLILTAGLAAIALGGWWPAAGAAAGWVAGVAASGLERVAVWTTLLPGHRWFLFPPDGWWVAGWFSLAGLAWVWGPKHKAWWLLPLAWSLWYPVFQPERLAREETRLTFFSLAVGEATLLRSGDGFVGLLDTGPEQEFYYRVRPCLASLGINRLDALVLSHRDADHAGGLAACLQSFAVRRLAAADLQALSSGRGPKLERWQRGQEEALGRNHRARVLWPPAGSHASSNETSLVLGWESPGGSLLFTGDSLADVEAQWRLPRPYEVLKAGHHGDCKASTFGLLQQCQPRLAVVMPGTRNPFGFPDPATLERLRQAGAVILDTRQGAVELRFQPRAPAQWFVALDGGVPDCGQGKNLIQSGTPR
jgi:competence protein ComEC